MIRVIEMLDAVKLKELFFYWAKIMEEHREELITLDGVCGDSDLGLTMEKGFKAAAKAVMDSEETDLGKLVYQSGKVMSQAVPSTMGTLMASGFMNAGKALKGKESLPFKEIELFFKAYYEGVQKRGGAQEGEKTFLDGLGPALKVFEEKENGDEAQRAQKALEAAKQGYENTCTMVAKHGRMAIREEKSKKIHDPGARVAVLLVQGYRELLAEGERT